MASHKIYEGAPLDLGSECIRLIEILPRDDSGIKRLKFHTYAISSCPDYYALSYTWGLATNQKRIIVDGLDFYIRENLWDFLHQQKYLKDSDLLWCDALSIDQGNVHERNHQVEMMATIFSRASCVVVWLGSAADGSDEAMDFLGSIPREAPTPLPLPWSYELLKNRPVSQLFKRRYWSRMWIVQELQLSRGWVLLCGKKTVDWTHIKALYEGSGQFFNRYKHVKAALNFRRQGRTVVEGRLTALVRSCKDQECEDLRDKIYALLGLVRDDGHDISVDYSCSTADLYGRVLKSTLKRDLEPLFFNLLSHGFERDLRLSLGLSSNDPSVQRHQQTFLDWCWVYRELIDGHRLSRTPSQLSLVGSEMVQCWDAMECDPDGSAQVSGRKAQRISRAKAEKKTLSRRMTRKAMLLSRLPELANMPISLVSWRESSTDSTASALSSARSTRADRECSSPSDCISM